ncbi:hypothetical protein MKW92_030367, partial [Papaver armeniacum]
WHFTHYPPWFSVYTLVIEILVEVGLLVELDLKFVHKLLRMLLWTSIRVETGKSHLHAIAITGSGKS